MANGETKEREFVNGKAKRLAEPSFEKKEKLSEASLETEYDGEYQDEKMHGKGTLKSRDGSVYVG